MALLGPLKGEQWTAPSWHPHKASGEEAHKLRRLLGAGTLSPLGGPFGLNISILFLLISECEKVDGLYHLSKEQSGSGAFYAAYECLLLKVFLIKKKSHEWSE